MRLALFLFTLLCCASTHASVLGRYIYYGNALSEPMGLVEVEVYSDGKNIIRDRPDVFTAGLDYGYWMKKRSPEKKAEAARMLTDGDVDTSQRRVDFASKIGGGYLDITLRYSSLELDLGEDTLLDTVSIYRSRYTQKQHKDLGWRIMVVLDSDRKIVAYNAFNVYGDDWRKNGGRWDLELEPAKGVPAGRVVPLGSRAWLSEAEYMQDFLGKKVIDLGKQMTAEDKARLARFEKRNTPAEIQALGRKFFRCIDLNHPDLEQVKRLVTQEKYAEAFEAFKRPFIAKLSPLKDWNAGEGTCIYVSYTWTTEDDTRYTGRSRDLRNHLYADRKDLAVKRFVPGLLPPAKLTFPFQMRPLLLNYAVSGNEEDLRLWEAMTDDWGMGFQDAADKDPTKLRDYFVLDIGTIRANLKDFYMAAQSRPEFVDQLNGATIARFLMPILEELPVANWRVTRKCNFNHTFNSIPGGLTVARLLPHFHAAQRMERELRQAFERQYTLSQYRDGSMVEIGDEGHYLATTSSPANLYGIWVNQGRPKWFTPALETYFLDNYRTNVESHVRNVAPHGVHVRWNARNDDLLSFENLLDMKDPYWRNVSGGRMIWGDYYTNLSLPTLTGDWPRSVIDTVYGRGRPTFDNRNKANAQAALTDVFPGEYQGEPELLSDWMPYSGLWYFRGGWDHEASFLHMVKPTNASNMGGAILYPLTNRYGAGQFNETVYRFSDYATPLTTAIGVLVDGLPPCPEEGRNPSGSKQDTFTQASEKPQPARWFTDDTIDFGEAIYTGNYRDVGLRYDHKRRESYAYSSDEKVENVTTHRQIIQVRPARLFLQIDRLRYSDDAEHTNRIEDTVILTGPADDVDSWEPNDSVHVNGHTVRTTNRDNPGLSITRIGQPELTQQASDKSLAHGSFGKYGTSITLNGYRPTTGRIVTTTWTGQGETVLLSVLRAIKANEQPIAKLDDLSTAQTIGAKATMADGVVVTILIARQAPSPLTIGEVSAEAEILLLTEQAGQQPTGLALGAAAISINGISQNLPAADLRFTLAERKTFIGLFPVGNSMQSAIVHRPLDPPTIGPSINTFTDNTKVTITTASPDADIYYVTEPLDMEQPTTLAEGLARDSKNITDWKLYRGPFTIRESTFVRARVMRRGVTASPLSASGIDASAIGYGFFHQRASKAPTLVTTTEPLQAGLEFDYLEDRWFALWTYTDQLEAKSKGTTPTLLDVSMRQTDGPFAVRYHGYIDIPADGIYTFYGPDEFVNNLNAPGYDLRLFVDNEEWYLTQVWHGRGSWSIPLKKGLHTFRVTFADARAKDLENQPIDLWRHYPWAETTWKGTAPTIDISGPDLNRQPIPNGWLKH